MESENEKNGILVSVFKNFIYRKDIDITTVISAIKNGTLEPQISKIRTLIKENNDDGEVLKKALPAFTPSATFEKVRQRECIVKYNQLIVLDIDDIQINVEADNYYIDTANNDKHTFATFISPSNTGFKILVKVNSGQEQHESAFTSIANYYEELLSTSIDRSGKDITRLCYISSDERAYFNENATVFNIEVLVEKNQAVLKSFASPNRLNISESTKQFEKIVEFTLNSKQFFKGNRNNCVHLMANNCNRRGIPIDDALVFITNSEFSYEPKEEVIKTIKSAYKNINEYNKYPLKIKNDNGVSDASVAVVVQQDFATKKGSHSMSIKTFNELAEIGKTLPPIKKLFGNFILDKSTTLFPSERGVGKTMLAMQIASSIANEKNEFLGEKIELNGNVFYVNLELREDLIAQRLTLLHSNNNISSPYNVFCFSGREGLDYLLPILTEEAKDKKPVLIIIDNLRTSLDGKNNENNIEMTQTITRINKFNDDLNSTVLIVHHNKKGSSNQLTHSDMQSGAGALTDLVDSVFFLRSSNQSKDFRILKRSKSRVCEEQDGAKLIKLNSETLWFEFVENEVNESEHIFYEKAEAIQEGKKIKGLALIKAGMSNSKIAEELGVDRSTVYRWGKES